jgi:U3 small nucleolar RNA-associated protein 20
MQKLLYDLRTTLTPKYEAIWDTLLAQATRSLPPAAFEVYVQTLSLFLKHLLLPSPEHCNLTWNKLSATIRKCRPDVRHKLAEVWGTIFRRLKTENRREITSLMLESLSTIQDAMAWIYITAFQSTSPMLHTSAVSLLDMLWDEALVAEDFEAVSRLLRRSLSATMHYCTIESFQPMAAMIATRVYALRGLHQDEEKCWRTMEIALVVYAFRKGGHARSMLNCE